MTGFNRPRSRNRDMQDYVLRGVWGDLAYVEGAGASLTIRGTGTVDEEVPMMVLGYGFNLPPDSDAELIMLSLGSDVNDRVALATIPRNFQHQWEQGQGGIQHPTDPERRIEFNADETYLSDGTFVLGAGREVTVSIADGNVSIQVNGSVTLSSNGAMTISASSVNIESGSLTHNGTNIGNTHKHPIAGGLSPSISGGPQ